MSERDPYDFSSLANDLDFGDDSESVLNDGDPVSGAGFLGSHQFVLSEEQIAWEPDLEGDFEALAEEGLRPPDDPDAEFRRFQEALRSLGDGLVDMELEAEEAFLNALMLEDGEAPPQPANAIAFLEGLRGGSLPEDGWGDLLALDD